MSDQASAERAELDKKDKSELSAIVVALGGKASSRSKKADLVNQILELSGVIPADGGAEAADPAEDPAGAGQRTVDRGAAEAASGDAAEPDDSDRDQTPGAQESTGETQSNQGQPNQGQPNQGQQGPKSRRRRGRREEPPAEWELEVEAGGGGQESKPADGDSKSDTSNGGTQKGSNEKSGRSGSKGQDSGDKNADKDRDRENNRDDKSQNGGDNKNANDDDDTEPGNRRRRRRGRGRERDDNVDAPTSELIEVTGYLDLRDDGYGFIRVDGHLPSKEDVYVPVKMARQHGLRKGDLITGTARAANRNEKNPALQELLGINGGPADSGTGRPDFESLTPVFPNERLTIERTSQPLDLTGRIIDLLAPIGKGQRALIVAPPKAGKTTILKELASSIEQNHPEVSLMVLLVDERPEEVTDMRRHLSNGEVISSTFDQPVEEHCAVAELALERAKRLAETGTDVVIILDGITRLARAYNLAASGSGRIMSGGVDAGALHPPRQFLGAARNFEEGGSLTVVATASIETGSQMDEVIFEAFQGTGNSELRLDRSLAEKLIFPAIDPLASSTRQSELLTGDSEHEAVMKFREMLVGLAVEEDDATAAGMKLLMERLRASGSNAEFLSEIANAP